MPTRDLSDAELDAIRLGEKWMNWRAYIYEARRSPLSGRDASRFTMETDQLLTTIQRLRPDLNVIALAELANMDFRNPPSNGELHLLVQDCESIVGEFTHALIYGNPGEYLSYCPNAENLIKSQPNPRDRLTATQKNLLTAAYELEAFDRESARTRAEIAERAGVGQPTSRNVREALAGLLRHGFMVAHRGPGGGHWITEAGRTAIDE